VYKSRNPAYVMKCMRSISETRASEGLEYGDAAADALADHADAAEEDVLTDIPMDSAEESEEARV